MADLAKAIQEAFVYQGQYSPHRKRNHGRPRRAAGGPLPGLHPEPRPGGQPRAGRAAEPDRGYRTREDRSGDGAAGPFVPMLFAGEEFAASTPFQYFTDFQEKELGRLVSEGRRREFVAFGWSPEEVPDPQAEETFLRSKLRWEESGQGVHAEMLEWYRRLIALRREESALTCGD